jgi:hypothetical protein
MGRRAQLHNPPGALRAWLHRSLPVGRSAEAFKVAAAVARLPSMPTVVLTSSTAPDAALNGQTFIAKPDLCARRLRLAMRPHEHDS